MTLILRRLRLQFLQRFPGLLGVRPVGQQLQILFVILCRTGQVAGLIQHLGELERRFRVMWLEVQRFAIAADGRFIILLLVVPVAILDSLHGLHRVIGRELIYIGFGVQPGLGMGLGIVRRRRYVDLRLGA